MAAQVGFAVEEGKIALTAVPALQHCVLPVLGAHGAQYLAAHLPGLARRNCVGGNLLAARGTGGVQWLVHVFLGHRFNAFLGIP